jgi:hypothetical protein
VIHQKVSGIFISNVLSISKKKKKYFYCCKVWRYGAQKKQEEQINKESIISKIFLCGVNL